jgi:hypothetical protein
MRTIPTAALDALDAGRYRVRCLLKITLDSPEPPFCIWDDVGTIVAGGDTYHGAAGRFTVDAATSVKDQSVRNLDLTLSGLDTAAIQMVNASNWHQRPIFVQRAILAIDAPTVLHLMPEFSGFVDTAIQREGSDGRSTLVFRCESASRGFDRGNARKRSDADQRLRDSNDGFYAFAAAAINKPIDWGTTAQKPRSGLKALIRKIF